MKISKRIISFISAFVTLFFVWAAPVSAAWYNDYAYSYTQSTLARWALHASIGIVSSTAGGIIGNFLVPGYGAVAGSALGDYVGMLAQDGLDAVIEELAKDSSYVSESDYISSMTTDSVSSAGNYASSVDSVKFETYVGTTSSYATDYNSSTAVIDKAASTSSSGTNGYWKGNTTYSFKPFSVSTAGYYTISNPYFYFNSSTSTISSSSSSTGNYGDFILYYSQDGGNTWSNYYKTRMTLTGSIQESSGLYVHTLQAGDYKAYLQPDCIYYLAYKVQNVFWNTSSTAYYTGVTAYTKCSGSPSLIFDSAVIADSDTRISNYITNVVNYNEENKYIDDSTTINYYIGTIDNSNNVTEIYNGNVYDDETLVFTEPVTGAQYQTSGWVYDYSRHSYDIDLESGTFYIDSYDIDSIYLAYGDEYLTIYYYSDNSLVSYDQYAYVLVSESDLSYCAVNGHTYNYEISSEATCTSVGIGLYTCSVCGDQYTETIPMKAHTYNYSILQEATETSSGIGLYTCSVCGNQFTEDIPATGGETSNDCSVNGHTWVLSDYTSPTCTENGLYIYSCSVCGSQYVETIEALGHDWVITETTTTSYDLPDNLICPDCDGDCCQWVFNEDDATYSCSCGDCDYTVSAVITYGATTYTCSRCGETYSVVDESSNPNNNLFKAIGNFISDGIGWIVDKLKSLIENISEINDIFSEWLSLVKEKAGNYPAFLSGFFDILPDDLTTVFWFSIVAFVAVVVWKRFFM